VNASQAAHSATIGPTMLIVAVMLAAWASA
jgi:hypothetical protein